MVMKEHSLDSGKNDRSILSSFSSIVLVDLIWIRYDVPFILSCQQMDIIAETRITPKANWTRLKRTFRANQKMENINLEDSLSEIVRNLNQSIYLSISI